jgi:hypothetical protein
MNDLYLIFDGCVQIFPFDYSNPTSDAIAFCKIRSYLPQILGQSAKTMLVLACIDHFIITSDRLMFRAFSTPIRAKYFIFVAIILI